ncbi:MAG TPA: hypothetical protein VGA04_22875, partial [Streptosporangiaceae bacterium]
MLFPVGVDAGRQVGGLALHHVVVTDPAPIAAGNTTAYTGSSGRLCQAFTSSSTASVIRETVSADSSVPYTCLRWCRMSRTLIPCAYR